MFVPLESHPKIHVQLATQKNITAERHDGHDDLLSTEHLPWASQAITVPMASYGMLFHQLTNSNSHTVANFDEFWRPLDIRKNDAKDFSLAGHSTTPHSKAKDETASHPCKVFPAPIFFYRACSIFSGRSAAISGSVFRRRIRKGFTKRRRDSWLQRFFGGGGWVAKWLQGVVPKLGWENWVPTWQIVRCQHEIVRKRHLKFCFFGWCRDLVNRCE